MKRLIGLILLAGLIYGGYVLYNQSSRAKLASNISTTPNLKNLTISKSSDKLSELAAVLGASVSDTFENGKELLSNATSGASEPIINELVTKTTDTLKDLPRREADKIKYEFCKGVVTEYENK